MLKDIIDSFHSMDVNIVNAMFRMLLSMCLGVIIGAERKRKGQIAGIRTFSLITMGACLAMLLSIYVPQEYMGLKNGDPGRIAAQVITGIGFLGGGAIIRAKGSVKGLTTAAGVWISAIIGMAVGVGMYLVSVCTTGLILVVLILFDWYEHWQRVGQESKAINISINGIVTDLSPYLRVLSENGMHLSTYFLEYDYVNSRTRLNLLILAHSRTNYMSVMSSLRQVNDTLEIALSSQVES
ncbi:MAG: MgtC/SapB family protein [Muribaculaceae bacterium]|nr:MgtC/SapB family protein [Muribaculaceae bacterium]